MNRNSVIYLISENSIQDDIGQWTTIQTARKVFGYVSSISQKEWFEGGRNGLNPSYQVKVFVGDYNGEQKVKIDDVIYTVYRTYIKDDEIELYLELRKGNENVSS